MKWRIREGHGEAIYEIGVEDDGALAGLQASDMVASLQTLKQMAVKLGATCSILRERTLDNGRQVAEVLVRKVISAVGLLNKIVLDVCASWREKKLPIKFLDTR